MPATPLAAMLGARLKGPANVIGVDLANLHDVFDIQGDRITMLYWPEELMVVPREGLRCSALSPSTRAASPSPTQASTGGILYVARWQRFVVA
jgi:hypothetical protein